MARDVGTQAFVVALVRFDSFAPPMVAKLFPCYRSRVQVSSDAYVHFGIFTSVNVAKIMYHNILLLENYIL